MEGKKHFTPSSRDSAMTNETDYASADNAKRQAKQDKHAAGVSINEASGVVQRTDQGGVLKDASSVSQEARSNGEAIVGRGLAVGLPSDSHSSEAAVDSGLPGAYATYPTGVTESTPFGIPEVENDTPEEPEPFRPSDDLEANQGLVEALPVADVPRPPEAMPVESEPDSEAANDTKQYLLKRLTAASGFLLVVILVPVIALSIRGSSTSEASPAVAFTATPTPAPTSTLDAALAMLQLPAYTIQTIENDINGTSPQSRALRWIMEDPNIYSYNQTRLLQRFVVATFYYSTNGNETWTHQGGEANITILDYEDETTFHKSMPWLSYGGHECHWFWTNAEDDGKICREDGSYQYLDLNKNGLSGTLPEELGILTWLDGFHFGWSNIQGTLPTQVGQMTLLKELKINSGNFAGTLPTELSLLSDNLEWISTLDNNFNGNLMEDLWQLSNLVRVYASRNHYGGSIPANAGHQFPHLEELSLTRNAFTGSLPTSIGLWSNLTDLSVGFNNFTGPLPTEMGNLSRLVEFYAPANQLTGMLPSELGLLTSMTKLMLDDNPRLSGPIPSELGQLTRLRFFKICNTNITGTVPDMLCRHAKFDCSPTLCGCDCPCQNTSNGNSD